MSDNFLDLVERDVLGKASEEESASLQADIDTAREWRDALVRMIQAADARLTRINAEVQQKNADCAKWGPTQKIEFFRFKSLADAEKASILKQKVTLVERLKEAKNAVQIMWEAEERPQDRNQDRLGRIEAKLDELLALMKHRNTP